MNITLELTETEAIYLKDALIDKSIELRTDANDRTMREEEFFNSPYVSTRRKQNYNTLRKAAEMLGHRFQI